MLSQTALLSSLLEHAVFPLSTKVLLRLYVCLLFWVLSVFVVVRRGSIDLSDSQITSLALSETKTASSSQAYQNVHALFLHHCGLHSPTRCQRSAGSTDVDRTTLTALCRLGHSIFERSKIRLYWSSLFAKPFLECTTHSYVM